uniref:Uncharacterized protein n=1 Tax=Anguilla anguilla TaxID=7936 RepID=A0A0E9QTB3_ANGAN
MTPCETSITMTDRFSLTNTYLLCWVYWTYATE